jgi:hypothetical protein
MNYLKISWKDFVETYKPIKNPLVQDASYDGYAFETYGAELDAVRKANEKDPDTVWTVYDQNEDEPEFEQDEDGDDIVPDDYEPLPLPISSGFHYVNRLCHMITEVPSPADTHVEVIDD